MAWLYHVEGLAQHEIAQELNISRRTVVNYLNAFNAYAEKFPSEVPARPLASAGRAVRGSA